MATREATGDCYRAAADLALDGQENGRFGHVCHGTVTGTGGDVVGERFGHAWVEVGDLVFDYSNGREVVVPREFYYAVGQIEPNEVRRYTPDEARTLMLEMGHYGPWTEEDE